MRILHVNKFFDVFGGTEVYMHETMKEQRARGHEVHAFSTRSPKNVASDDARFFVTRSVLNRKEGPKADALKAMRFVWNQEARRAMQEMLRDVRPDVVHLHNLYHHLSTSILGPIRAAGIPCVQTLHDYKLACPNYKMFVNGAPCERCKGGKYREAIKNECLFQGAVPNMLAVLEMNVAKLTQAYERTVKTFICPSNFMREKMEDWGEPANKLVCLPNPIRIPDASVPRGGGYLVYTGRLSPEKGLAGFLRAAVQLPDIPVKIIGTGPQEEELKALVRDAGAHHIEFLGFKPPVELAPIRARAEACLLPAIAYENCSIALLEAMADGLPCLTTRIGGNPELVKDGENGFLAKPDDERDWMRILRRFQATTPEARAAMGVVGRERARVRHGWTQHLDALERLYASH